MYQVSLKSLKVGDFFKRKADASKVYTRGNYDRTDKKYAGNDWDDISRAVYLKGETLVWVGFEF